MRILGIDPGTKCGWALREPDGAMTSGVWQLKHGRHDSDGMKLIRLSGYLSEVYRATPFGLIAYEEVRRHLGTDAAHIYGALYHKIQEWVISMNHPPALAMALGVPLEQTKSGDAKIEHTGIPVGTIKKFATGKGNASKEFMIMAADDKWGETWHDLNDNEADARWIAECAASQLGVNQ